MGRDGEQPEDPQDEGQPEGQRERAVRGRPGERSRGALADLTRELQAGLRDDLPTLGADVPARNDDGASHARHVLGICVDAVVGARRLAGWCEFVQLLAVARLLTAWAGRPPILDERVGPDPCGVGEFSDPALADRLHAVADGLGVFVPTGERLDTSELADAFVAAEVAAAAGISVSAGYGRVAAATALFLTDRLPRTRVLLRAGLLDATKLSTVLRGTAVVADDALCALVEARLIPDPDLALAQAAGTPGHVLDTLDPSQNPDGPGTGLPWVSRATNPAVAARITRIIAQVDAQAAAERAEKARANRHVRAEALPDGMGALTVETGREAITAIVGDLDACVATAKAAGDDRTPGQIRADELVHRMSLGAFGAPALPTPSCTGTGTTSHGTTGSGVRALRVGLTMPLATWLGIADEPGVLDGYGPIPAALARQIAAEAARDHPATTTWRCVPLDDTHRTVLGVGDTIPTPRHDPTPRQRDLVTAAEATCVWPGCGRHSTGCDVDHRIPYEDGGATCPCNLQPLCRRHHRMKGSGLISAVPDPHARIGSDATGATDTTHATGATVATVATGATGATGAAGATPVGSLLWTTWTGRTYRHTPEPATEPPLTHEEEAAIGRARLRRALDDAGAWADPDDPHNDTPSGGLRARLHDIATSLRIAGPVDLADHDTTTPETISGIESWRYAIRRHDGARDRETRAARRRAARTEQADRTHLSADLDDECPF